MLRRPFRCDDLYSVSSKDDPDRLQAEMLKIGSTSSAIIGLGQACLRRVSEGPVAPETREGGSLRPFLGQPDVFVPEDRSTLNGDPVKSPFLRRKERGLVLQSPNPNLPRGGPSRRALDRGSIAAFRNGIC